MSEMDAILEACDDQFVLTRRAAALPGCFTMHERAGWKLGAHRKLRVRDVVDAAGEAAGWLLGEAIDERGEPAGEAVKLGGGELHAAAERWCDAQGGRFVLIMTAGDEPRIYPDAMATMSVVYDAKRGMAGSTLTMLLAGEPGHDYWRYTPANHPANRANSYFPAGQTAAEGITRLLPNHRLDLARWEAARYRVTGPVERIGENDTRQIDDAIERIAEGLGANLRGAMKLTGGLYLPLTVGMDSRILAAAAWGAGLADEARFVTFQYRHSNRGNRLDEAAAAAIARGMKLRHQFVPVTGEGGAEADLQYLRRIGFSGTHGKRYDFDQACREHLDLSRAWATGFGGEVGRAYYWPWDMKLGGRVELTRMLEWMRLEPEGRTIQAMERWRSGTTGLDAGTELDLCYWEHRAGCWAGAHQYGAAPFALKMMAYSRRSILETMMRLPGKFRKTGGVYRMICRRHCPEMLRYPESGYVRMRGVWRSRWLETWRDSITAMLLRRGWWD